MNWAERDKVRDIGDNQREREIENQGEIERERELECYRERGK